MNSKSIRIRQKFPWDSKCIPVGMVFFNYFETFSTLLWTSYASRAERPWELIADLWAPKEPKFPL